jgi:hypothetical protein
MEEQGRGMEVFSQDGKEAEMTEDKKADQRFKTMRHIETVRNMLNSVIRELLNRAEQHDQSKLQSPEREVFDEYTQKLRGCTYGSDEYKQFLKEMSGSCLKHHYENNRHHPEHFKNGVLGMDLVDLIEMFVDWLAATKRHADGNIMKSIDINKKPKLNDSNTLAEIFRNTALRFYFSETFNHAEES